jgi:hypothetical protein
MNSLFVRLHVVCVFHFNIFLSSFDSFPTKPVYHWTVAGVPLVARLPQFEKPWSREYGRENDSDSDLTDTSELAQPLAE